MLIRSPTDFYDIKSGIVRPAPYAPLVGDNQYGCRLCQASPDHAQTYEPGIARQIPHEHTICFIVASKTCSMQPASAGLRGADASE